MTECELTQEGLPALPIPRLAVSGDIRSCLQRGYSAGIGRARGSGSPARAARGGEGGAGPANRLPAGQPISVCPAAPYMLAVTPAIAVQTELLYVVPRADASFLSGSDAVWWCVFGQGQGQSSQPSSALTGATSAYTQFLVASANEVPQTRPMPTGQPIAHCCCMGCSHEFTHAF